MLPELVDLILAMVLVHAGIVTETPVSDKHTPSGEAFLGARVTVPMTDRTYRL